MVTRFTHAAPHFARLGYGRKRERDADECALSAILDLEYEPQSVCRYLRRLHAAIERGDEAVAETAVAHPTPYDRLKRIEHALFARVGATADVPRVNREVFRRALAPSVLAASLVRTELDAPQPLPWGVTVIIEKRPRGLNMRYVAAAVAALVALVTFVVWWARS